MLPGAVEPLAPQDRARAQRIATETLRWASRADRVLGPYLKRRPSARTHAALRMAVWEMLGDGAAAHGVVNAAVTLLTRAPGRAEAGLANAVLRRIATAAPDWDALPLPELPKWLRRPLVAAWGKDAVAAIEAAHAAGAALDLTPGPRGPDDLAQRVGGTVLPTGSIRVPKGAQVSILPGYDEGWWWVQDAAAAVPVRMLDTQPGERIVDLCAAPGGKTLQLAAAGAEVTAVDVSPARMAVVRENLARTGLAATCVSADALTWAPDAPVDAVLLDAPCSATGTIRRHPDLPHAKDGSEASGAGRAAGGADRPGAGDRPARRAGRVLHLLAAARRGRGAGPRRARPPSGPGGRGRAGGRARPGLVRRVGLRLRPDYWRRGGRDGRVLRRAPAKARLTGRSGDDRADRLG